MTTILKQTEAAPASYPTMPTSPAILSDAAAALDSDMIWQRIESYVAHRWTERAVTWIVEGPGEFAPPLAPCEVTAIDIWSRAAEWETAEPTATPLGYWLPCTGPYRFTATVGADAEVPAAVLEAFRRLAEYFSARAGKQGATRESVTAGSVAVQTSRSASWMAQAIQNSGAADLLRPYRRAG